jgi:circadian clock protein KaiC
MGLPGSGKTTLASQIGFTAAAAGKTTLILTALSESTSKLISHLSAFRFYDPALIGGPVQFLSLQSVLPQGLAATADVVIGEVRRINAHMVLIDDFRGMRSVDTEPQAAREFLYRIGTTLGVLGATTLLTLRTG